MISKLPFLNGPRNAVMAACFAAACIFIAVAAIGPHTMTTSRGDATFEDHGFWSYPRYFLRFPEIAISTDHTYRFLVKGIPAVPTTFSFTLARGADFDSEQLQSEAAPYIGVSIDDADGNRIYTFSGVVKDWVWAAGGGSCRLWHQNLRHMRLQSETEYILVIEVRNQIEHEEQLWVAPNISGGGNELP